MQDVAVAASSSSSSGTGIIIPSVRMAAGVTVKALDSLPLPLLAVVFIVCVALLQWPFPPTSPLLPTFTPPTTEKERLSPVFEKSNAIYKQLQTYSLTSSSSAAGGQIPSQTGTGTKMLVKPLPRRKGSKQLREWKNRLGPVAEVEVEGEMVHLDV